VTVRFSKTERSSLPASAVGLLALLADTARIKSNPMYKSCVTQCFGVVSTLRWLLDTLLSGRVSDKKKRMGSAIFGKTWNCLANTNHGNWTNTTAG
jgi:anaerobic C4-dicarboxylate transporter